MIASFATEIEKIAAYSVRGGRGAPRKGKGTPAGVTQPGREPGGPQVSSVGTKIPKFNKKMKSAIAVMSRKPTAGKLGPWG